MLWRQCGVGVISYAILRTANSKDLVLYFSGGETSRRRAEVPRGSSGVTGPEQPLDQHHSYTPCCQLAADGLCVQCPSVQIVNTYVLEVGQPCLPQVSEVSVVPSWWNFFSPPVETEAPGPVLFGASLSLIWSHRPGLL